MNRKQDETAPPEVREAFLSRWSRKKEEARQPPASMQKAREAESPLPELPPLDQLTIDSDYRAFFHPKVEEDVRRAALKKLFSDPRFNVMDGLDVYVDDYTGTVPIPPEMLAGLRQVQNILAWAKEDEEARAKEAARVASREPGTLAPPVDSAVHGIDPPLEPAKAEPGAPAASKPESA
jgi:hypothetical protein